MRIAMALVALKETVCALLPDTCSGAAVLAREGKDYDRLLAAEH
jgi:hypothetical protein